MRPRQGSPSWNHPMRLSGLPCIATGARLECRDSTVNSASAGSGPDSQESVMAWTQVYDPFHNWILSTLVAALPILVLFGLLGGLRLRPHWCAMAAATTAALVAITAFHMPPALAGMSFLYGVGFGVLKIAWIVLAAVYLYDITVATGQFEIMKFSISNITADRRLQLLLVAFCFGAFIEGAAGFGSPVAIAGAFMIGLGFKPFYAASLNLIANTAPVAWGAIGTPVHTLAAVTALPESDLNAMIGRILPLASVVVPFWLVRTMVGWRKTFEVLPAILVVGVSFALTQFLWSNFVDGNLVDIVGGMVSLAATVIFLRFWKPRRVWRFAGESEREISGDPETDIAAESRATEQARASGGMLGEGAAQHAGTQHAARAAGRRRHTARQVAWAWIAFIHL